MYVNAFSTYMKYTLHKLRILHEIIHEGSMNKAAIRLNMSQSSISRALISLEISLGFRIFYRSKKTLSLTKEGKALLVEMNKLLVSAEKFEQSVVSIKHGIRELRIGAPVGLATQFMPEVIKQYKLLTKHAEIRLETRSSPSLHRDIEDGVLDVAIVATVAEQSASIVSKKIINAPLVCIVPTDHPLSELETIDIGQLCRHDIIFHSNLDLAGEWIKDIDIKLFEKAQIISNIASISGLVAKSLGVSVMNFISGHDMSDPEKVKIIPYVPKTDLYFYLIYRRDWAENNNLNHLLKAFDNSIKGYLYPSMEMGHKLV